MCVGTPPKDYASQIAIVDAIIQTQRAAASMRDAAAEMPPIFGEWWRGLDSEWELLNAQVSWIRLAQERVQTGAVADWALEAERFRPVRAEAERCVQASRNAEKAYVEAVANWRSRLELDESVLSDGPLAGRTFQALVDLAAAQVQRLEDLHTLATFNQVADQCCKDGLSSVLSVAVEWDSASRHLVSLFVYSRLSALLSQAFVERPALKAFDGPSHSNTVEQFRLLDRLQMDRHKAVLAAGHAQGLPSYGSGGQVGVLWNQFERRRRFMPIRKLVKESGNAIQAIKPVFMMSPLSIANYLPPGAVNFDLVIFDEASQVKPVDALGAIGRGAQIVVVGDSKQLPPTSFFDSLVGPDQVEDDTEAPTEDIESILGLFCSRGAPQRMLRWHYRSRHESLIAVSNHLFYDDRLVVFPSPDRVRRELGLLYRRIGGAFYDRSKTRTNPTEAKAVAAAVMEHARAQLRLRVDLRDTLGVAAFSVAQMDAIEIELEILRRRNPSCEEFFSHHSSEPFFVKNLESVQGDERDVIFISVGYGRTADGYMAMSFGPLNRMGGERRLNVLITRARKRCEVFTGLSEADIDLSRTSSVGVAALKKFLAYAETGNIEIGTPTGREPESDFEEQLQRALTKFGHTVHTQVGCAGFFLDLAVVDPGQPGRYLLGIECDGARYHSARSARDRDRLQQAVLEGLNWRIHRIWSTDWFRNPEQELRKVLGAIEAAKVAYTDGPRKSSEVAVSASVRDRETPTATVPVSAVSSGSQNGTAPPYRCAEIRIHLNGLELHLVDRRQLASKLGEVVHIESPVHWMEAARRIATAVGVQKLGSRIQAAFQDAVRVGSRDHVFKAKGDFLWSREMDEPTVRDRSSLPLASRKMELVAPEEVRSAIISVVRSSYGMAPDEIAPAVCRLFGFGRVTDDMRRHVEPQRDALVREGRLVSQGGSLVVSQP